MEQQQDKTGYLVVMAIIAVTFAYNMGVSNGKSEEQEHVSSVCEVNLQSCESKAEEAENKLSQAYSCIFYLKNNFQNAVLDFNYGNFGIAMSELQNEPGDCIGL